MDKGEQQAPPYLFPENQFALQLRIIWANFLEEYKLIIFFGGLKGGDVKAEVIKKFIMI